MLIKYIEQKSYCVRSMQKLEKDGLWGPFQHSDLLLTVPVFYTFMAITCIHKFQTQFPTSQIDIYTTAYYIASLIGWVYISLSFFLEKKHVFIWGAGESFTIYNWGQWTTWRIQFSPFTTMQIPGLELRPSGLAARVLNQWAISLTLHPSIDASQLMMKTHLINLP